MEIIVKDDKKEKYQSVSCVTEFNDMAPMGHCNMYLEGYGANTQEAEDSLLAQATKLQSELALLINALTSKLTALKVWRADGTL